MERSKAADTWRKNNKTYNVYHLANVSKNIAKHYKRAKVNSCVEMSINLSIFFPKEQIRCLIWSIFGIDETLFSQKLHSSVAGGTILTFQLPIASWNPWLYFKYLPVIPELFSRKSGYNFKIFLWNYVD